jgi:predicted dehydrogenase
MLRLGIVDCDTSHVYQFSRRLNHVGIEPAQWVDGATVVAAFVGSSRVTDADRITDYVSAMCETGVALVDHPEDLLGRVDAVLIESNEGGVHRARATPFMEAGLPVFIDKPLATSTTDARALVDLAAHHRVPLLSASSLRFSPQIGAVRADALVGSLRGADVHAPAKLHEANPGLFHYGVHGVEMLYALLGAGCQEVACSFEEQGEVVTGRWHDGRLGVVRGLREGASDYGLTAYGEVAVRAISLDTESMYFDLLSAVIPVLSGEPSPISPEELVEVVAFQEAALASRNAGGCPVEIVV